MRTTEDIYIRISTLFGAIALLYCVTAVAAVIKRVANKKLQMFSPWKTIYANGKKAEINYNGLVIMDTKPGGVYAFSEE